MEFSKQRVVENLFEYLKENQKTVNNLIRLAAPESHSEEPTQVNGRSDKVIYELLNKLSELIELNRMTLETIDLVDKRVKRLHGLISPQPPEQPIEGEKSEETEG